MSSKIGITNTKSKTEFLVLKPPLDTDSQCDQNLDIYSTEDQHCHFRDNPSRGGHADYT